MLQTKFGVRQSWATCFFLVHLGCLTFGMLEPWLWWNGLGLHLEGLNLDYDLLIFSWNGLRLRLKGMHLVSSWPLMDLSVGLRMIQETILVFIPSRVQSQAFGLEFINSIQGSNNYGGFKCWTWAHHDSNYGRTHA